MNQGDAPDQVADVLKVLSLPWFAHPAIAYCSWFSNPFCHGVGVSGGDRGYKQTTCRCDPGLYIW